VTVVTTRRVKPGREADFEVWLEGIGAEAARFPGLVGRRITRPADHDHPEYVIVFKFDSYPHLRAWTESPARRRWQLRATQMHSDRRYGTASSTFL